ncbi:hypothetical protein [Mycolicibacterium porcinum]|uniref:HNH endonuclease n=1 Tax=Mycolicibacterium porcinum TaxID=39693 RepID=A0ABV3VHU8_9MYCO
MTDPIPTTVPLCRAESCNGVANLAGLCDDHIRARKLTTKIQDALLEFLHVQQGATLQSSVGMNPENQQNVELAGWSIAQGIALLVSTCFESGISFDPEPISLVSKSLGPDPNWRVRFIWTAGKAEPFELEDIEHDDDQDDET